MRNERLVRYIAACIDSGIQNGTANIDPHSLLQEALLKLDNGVEYPENAILMFVDDRGEILARSDSPESEQDAGYLADLATDTADWTIKDTPKGRHIIIASSPVGQTGWRLVMQEAWTDAASPLVRYSQLTPLVLAPALLMAAAGLIFGIRQVIQPLERLGANASRLGEGDYDKITEPVGGIGEIQQLQDTLAHVAGQLRQARDQMRCYTSAITQGQEDERARVARELHDETIQTFIALELQAHLILRALNNDPEIAAGKVKELVKLAQDGVKDVRRMIYALRPLYLDDLGWLPAVQALVSDLEEQGNITTSLSITGQERRLDPVVELSLFRITQEAVRNAARHSKADKLDVLIEFSGQVQLTIIDNGKGFDPITNQQALLSAGHYGLVGMHERAQLIGAQLEVDSAPGKGTRITVIVGNQEI